MAKKPTLRVAREVCLELADHSVMVRSAKAFFDVSKDRDSNGKAARLTTQFIRQNQTNLSRMGIVMASEFDGQDVRFRVSSTSYVGAIPLLSPTTGKPAYGLVVRPRFEWSGIGPMLAQMGWLIVPSPLRLPLLPRSERRVPAWVMSTMILARIEAMLKNLLRRFEVIAENRQVPRGSVNWGKYATGSVAYGELLRVPCRFPDLRDDRALQGAIHFALEKQLRSLEGLNAHGSFIGALVEICESLIRQVRDAKPSAPSMNQLQTWLRGSMRTEVFRDGLQAVEWTVEERALAGLSDLEGVPWLMPMDEFFEAWVEMLFGRVSRLLGGHIRSGRKRETLVAMQWEPPSLGSQKFLLPDITVEFADTMVIIDAKYKRHWEEMQRGPWSAWEEEAREEHRRDLLQVLAYGNLTSATKVVVCLVYPCRKETWKSLVERGRDIHAATITAGARRIHLWLTAMPMGGDPTELSSRIAHQLRDLAS